MWSWLTYWLYLYSEIISQRNLYISNLQVCVCDNEWVLLCKKNPIPWLPSFWIYKHLCMCVYVWHSHIFYSPPAWDQKLHRQLHRKLTLHSDWHPIFCDWIPPAGILGAQYFDTPLVNPFKMASSFMESCTLTFLSLLFPHLIAWWPWVWPCDSQHPVLLHGIVVFAGKSCL